MEVDGYYVYQPTGGGFLSEGLLREIADDHAERNKAWHEELCKALKELPSENSP